MEGAAGLYNVLVVEEDFKDFKAVEEKNSNAVEKVFEDFKRSRAGIIKALTADVEKFYYQCDPEKDKLCLYGFPMEETWEVCTHYQLIPPDVPEPTLGINIARATMPEKDWLSLVAVHSDAWLLAEASYFCAYFGFEKNDRGRLFNMINELPTIFEVVTGTNRLRRMEGAAGPYNGRTVEEVFEGFRGRRAGMIKALTTDVEEFYQQCDPEKGILCLYGIPSETWKVSPPDEEVPPQLPEPSMGINFARDGTPEKDWLSFVAVQSDAWLLAVAFYFGAYFGFEKNDRGRLFNMINELPMIFEVVTGTQHVFLNHRQNVPKLQPPHKEEDDTLDEEDEEEHGDTLCGACGENHASDEFWIFCDVCEIWFHGKCVKIKQYKCPSCSRSTKRARA